MAHIFNNIQIYKYMMVQNIALKSKYDISCVPIPACIVKDICQF